EYDPRRRHDHRPARRDRGGARHPRGAPDPERDLRRALWDQGPPHRVDRVRGGAASAADGSRARMSRALIVLPDDSAAPILKAIEGADRTLRIKMFVFSDPMLLKAVVEAKRRGVSVRVMLNPARRSGEQDNEATRQALQQAHIDVQDANPAFDLTHEKSMVVDDHTAFVQSLNWTAKNMTETRDYAVVTKSGHDVAEIFDCFETDWHRETFEPRDKSQLVWCPGPGRDRICRFIDEARHTLFVQNERFQDME